MEEFDAAFLCRIHSRERNIILKHCISHKIKLFMIPRIADVMMRGSEQIHMLYLPILKTQRYKPSIEYQIIKRTMDIVVSGIATIVLSPLFLITAIAVKSDGGPAFYKQKRLTKDGKVFEILKFRSMRVDAEKYSGAVLSAGENDPRITKVGRIIRACRLDELPQLLNILKGDMSLVGPRPERPELQKEIEKEVPEFGLRLQAKAGLTGYAQVYGKYNTTFYEQYANQTVKRVYMDIMPGQSVGRGTEIIVPDRELKHWYHHSNPIGYAEWFEEQARTHIINELAQYNKVQKNAEPIDDQEVTTRLEPLRRAVQLIKYT